MWKDIKPDNGTKYSPTAPRVFFHALFMQILASNVLRVVSLLQRLANSCQRKDASQVATREAGIVVDQEVSLVARDTRGVPSDGVCMKPSSTRQAIANTQQAQ